jgi:uncharacterized protein
VFGVSQATVSRRWDLLRPVIGNVLAEVVPDPRQVVGRGTVLVDGTVCPTWDWAHVPDLFSAKTGYPGMNLQIAATLDGETRTGPRGLRRRWAAPTNRHALVLRTVESPHTQYHRSAPGCPRPLPRTMAGSYPPAMAANEPGSGETHLEVNVCWALLRSQEVGRLAVSIAARPEIFPINFVVDHGTVVFRTAEGTKLAGAVQGDAVAFEADGYERDTGEAWSVVVKGHAEEIGRAHDLFDTVGLPLFPWHAAPKQRFVRIVPDEVSGRRFHVIDRVAWRTHWMDAPTSATE